MSDYKITQPMAQALSHFVYDNTGYHTIICNEQAIIIADSEEKRIGLNHMGAAKILGGHIDEYFMTAEDAMRDSTVKEGQNYPVEVDGIRVGTFGIVGKLDYVRPIAKVVAALFSARLKQAQQMELVSEVAHKVSHHVHQVAATIEENSASSEELATTTDSVAKLSEDTVRKVKDTGKILDMSRGIATQTKLLSLNASIEAARAGVQGRGFAVVAQEMQKLAQNSADATENINRILQEIQQSIQKVIEGIHQSAIISNEQATAMQEMIQIIEEVQLSATELVASFK